VADFGQIKANFFLPGNSTIDTKNEIVQKEMVAVQKFADNSTRQGYKNVSIQMTLLATASNAAQPRYWSGAAKLPVGNKQALISFGAAGSFVDSQPITVSKQDQFVREKTELARFVAEFNRNNTDMVLGLTGVVSYDVHTLDGVSYTHSGESLGYFEPSIDENETLNSARMQLELDSPDILTRAQVEKAENALKQKGYLFTFLSG